jgi:hypothetical protein
MESDDTAPTRVKLAMPRSQEEEQQDVQMASTSADPLQGITSPANQEIRDVELVAPHPGIDIMEDVLSEERSVELSSEAAALFPWDGTEKIRSRRRIHLLAFLSDQYPQIKREYCNVSSVGKLLDKEPWLIPVIDKHWKEGSFHVIRRLREYLEHIS